VCTEHLHHQDWRTATVRAALATTGLAAALAVAQATVRATVAPTHPLARASAAVPGWLSLGTTGLFIVPGHRTLTELVNATVAVGAWLLVAGGALCLVRAITARAAEPKPSRALALLRRMPRATRIIFVSVAVIGLAELAGFGGTYLLYSSHYVSTDNALVDGDKIEINAPTSGAVTEWTINEGSSVHTHQIVGRVRPVGGGARPARAVLAPGAGTVAVNDVVNGSYVRAGTELATAYDLSHIYVTARINDSDIDAVRPGALVNLSVDAFPGVPMTGIVQVVQNATASTFNVYPATGTADPSNPHPVTQYIPVKIELLSAGGKTLAPGMSATVHIARAR
jgi:multidrug efflux pump subunit AcrA (membrane-fusion protein)